MPLESVGFITGYRGESLRAIERDSGSFCFTDGDKNDKSSGRDHEKLLIFSHSDGSRSRARDIVEDKIDMHKRMGDAAPSYGSGGGGGGYGGGGGGGYGGGGGGGGGGAGVRALVPPRSPRAFFSPSPLLSAPVRGPLVRAQ